MVALLLDKLMRRLCATFYLQAPDPNSGGLKNQEKISQFCAVGISFPTKGASFIQKKFIKFGLLFNQIS